MKKTLQGYTIVFNDRNDKPVLLTPEEGEKLLAGLEESPMFINLASKGKMIRTATIDRIDARYKNLEQRCLDCEQLRPIGSKCPNGCDDVRNLDEERKKTRDRLREEMMTDRCKACDVMCRGEYCDECKGLYD